MATAAARTRILQLGLNLAADERPLVAALGTTTRVESVAFLQGNACSIHKLADAPGTPGIIHDFDGRASACTSMGRVLIVGDASGKLHRLDANGFAVLGGAEMRQRAAQISAQASQGAQKGLVSKSLGALGGFASSVVGLLGDEEDPAGCEIDDGAVTALACTDEGDVFAFLATGACQRWRLGATASFVCAHEAFFCGRVPRVSRGSSRRRRPVR